MTVVYDWPAVFSETASFEMRVIPNTWVFTSQFTNSVQTRITPGERWRAMVGIVPGVSLQKGAAIEAFFDRLQGPTNRIRLWNLRRPRPLGTISGVPTLVSAIAVGSGTASIQVVAGETLLAGDHIGLPNGQNVRIMVDTVADAGGSGVMAIEFLPRARTAMPSGSITLIKPTVNFMLQSDGVPIVWAGAIYQNTAIDLIEAI